MAHLIISSKDIRTLDGLYFLNDLHKAAGSEKRHEPNRFIRTEKTKELIELIERCPEMGIGAKAHRGGVNQDTWGCKELVYAYAMWISPKLDISRQAVSPVFKHSINVSYVCNLPQLILQKKLMISICPALSYIH